MSVDSEFLTGIDDLDEAWTWIEQHTHYVNIRRMLCPPHWSVLVFVDRPKNRGEQPTVIADVSFPRLVAVLLGHVMDERRRLGIRGGDR